MFLISALSFIVVFLCFIIAKKVPGLTLFSKVIAMIYHKINEQ